MFRAFSLLFPLYLFYMAASSRGKNQTSHTKDSGKEVIMEQTLQQVLQRLFNKDLSTASETEVFRALMVLTQEELDRRPLMQGTRKLYYISAEFLIGKLLLHVGNLIAIKLLGNSILSAVDSRVHTSETIAKSLLDTIESLIHVVLHVGAAVAKLC